jgi:hypothetical protein
LENANSSSQIKQVTLQFTTDGKAIYGVSIYGNEPDSKKSVQIFKEIREYLNSKMACITIEEPPPISSLEFVKFCKKRYIPIG